MLKVINTFIKFNMSFNNNEVGVARDFVALYNCNSFLQLEYAKMKACMKLHGNINHDLSSVYVLEECDLRGFEFFFEFASGLCLVEMDFSRSLDFVRNTVLRYLWKVEEGWVDSGLWSGVREIATLREYMSGVEAKKIIGDSLVISDYLDRVGSTYIVEENGVIVTEATGRNQLLLRALADFIADWESSGYIVGVGECLPDEPGCRDWLYCDMSSEEFVLVPSGSSFELDSVEEAGRGIDIPGRRRRD